LRGYPAMLIQIDRSVTHEARPRRFAAR
jgi:hypothetical protein